MPLKKSQKWKRWTKWKWIPHQARSHPRQARSKKTIKKLPKSSKAGKAKLAAAKTKSVNVATRGKQYAKHGLHKGKKNEKMSHLQKECIGSYCSRCSLSSEM